MRTLPDSAEFSRPAASPLGKRIARIQFSAPELIKKRLHEEAQECGMRPERLAEAVFLERYGLGHVVIVHHVKKKVTQNNCSVSEDE